MQAKPNFDPGAAARIRHIAYDERIGLANARGHTQRLLARLGSVEVLRCVRIATARIWATRCSPAWTLPFSSRSTAATTSEGRHDGGQLGRAASTQTF